MNGGADLGGMQGFGPVVDVQDEPHYHADWEARVMAMVVALGACEQWNIDQSRHARESLSPVDYLSFPYYRIWFEAACKLMLDRGMVTELELASGESDIAAIAVPRIMEAAKVWDMIHSLAGAADRPATGEPAFSVGDAVCTINAHPAGHTRLPRYARGKTGTIEAVIGHHVYPDVSGNDGGDVAEWLYRVRFSARELWGEQANPNDSVTVDLWQPHLRPV